MRPFGLVSHAAPAARTEPERPPAAARPRSPAARADISVAARPVQRLGSRRPASPGKVRFPPVPEDRRRANPYRLYLYGIEGPLAVLTALAQTTCVVYYVTSGHLNPLQLVTLGTSVELSYFVMQLPTGLLADLVSRRLCVVAGTILLGIGLGEQGLSAGFANLLAGQF